MPDKRVPQQFYRSTFTLSGIPAGLFSEGNQCVTTHYTHYRAMLRNDASRNMYNNTQLNKPENIVHKILNE